MEKTELRFADQITREHAKAFADRWFKDTYRSGDLFNAFAAAGVMEWPDPSQDNTPAQGRYNDVETEILERTCAAVREAVAEAFLTAATEVIERERRERATVRYPHHEPAVNAVLDVARAARRLEEMIPGTSSANIMQHLAAPASAWGWSLVEIVMELEEEREREQRPAGKGD